MNIKVAKIRPEAKMPERAHPTDAGMDLFYCPNENKKLYDETRSFYIPPRESRVIPTGIKVEIPSNHMLEIKNRSSVASKRGLIVGACVCDSGYNGEIFVNLLNVGQITQVIAPGQKIAQAVLVPVVCCGVEEVQEGQINKLTERGEGAFGSTGN